MIYKISMVRICDLIDGAETGVEAIYEPALALLAENEMESSTWYLCELPHVIAPRVSRTALKEAMLKCLIKYPKQREDIVYTLHKNGFRDVCNQPVTIDEWKGFIRMNKITLCPTTTSTLNRVSKFWICPEHSQANHWESSSPISASIYPQPIRRQSNEGQ